MSEIKQRDYMFDTFRGLLMWSIPISHFTRVAGHFSQGSLSGIIYITINVFVMQAFVFLSGYFSKKPDRARETAFHTFLWPYLLCIPFFYCVRHIIWGNAHLYLDLPPFALWYLFALFFYRFFLKDYIKIPYVFEISMLVYLFAGQVPFFSDTWALGRMVSYFPFFLLGYYCDKDTLKRIRSLKKAHCWILGIVLMACSCILAFCVKDLKVGFYLLKSPACELG
ncbi:MAG: acyltransferase family protein, partial [Anaerovoracaceae bacterium]